MVKANREIYIDIRTAPRDQMERAFAYERQQIALRLAQISIDMDSYNENWNKGEPLTFVYDFADDVKELLVGGFGKTKVMRFTCSNHDAV